MKIFFVKILKRALGIIFFEMVTGNLPFQGRTESDVILAIKTKNTPILPDYYRCFQNLLEKLGNKNLIIIMK